MNKDELDFDIDVYDDTDVEEASDTEADSLQLPMNFLSLGEIAPDDVRIYIRQDVFNALEEYAASDTSTELGTILIGDMCREHGGLHVIISDYIEAKYTDASASTLTFTHETWDYVNREKEERFPDKKIVGWQHTHPGYGIFLSNYDMFIQENFFDLPFQVAYVIDPKQQIRGFFQWKNSKVEKADGFYVYDEVGKKINPQLAKSAKKENKRAEIKKSDRFMGAFLVALVTVLLGVSITSVSLMLKYRTEIDALSGLVASSQNSAFTAEVLTSLIRDELTGKDSLEAVDRIIALIEDGTLKIDDAEKVIAELNAFKEELSKDGKGISFIIYTVEEGDTLSDICAKHGLDYDAIGTTLVALNGLENENTIFAGGQLIIPVCE